MVDQLIPMLLPTQKYSAAYKCFTLAVNNRQCGHCDPHFHSAIFTHT